MYAIETVNQYLFIDIGGLGSIDLNFEFGPDHHFPLFIASIKGK